MNKKKEEEDRMVSNQAKAKAKRKWVEANRGLNTYASNKRSAKNFIVNKASLDDLNDLKTMLAWREDFLIKSQERISKIDSAIKNDFIKGTYYLDLKSKLLAIKPLQNLWEEFKTIKGDPILLIDEKNTIYNLDDIEDVKTLSQDYHLDEEETVAIFSHGGE